MAVLASHFSRALTLTLRSGTGSKTASFSTASISFSDQLVIPKKPGPSSYGRYVSFRTQGMRKEYPSLSMNEVIRKIAQEWANLPDTKKKSYQEEAKEEYAAYLDEMNTLKEKALTNPELKRTLDNIAKDARDKKLAKQLKTLTKEKSLLEENKPKRPPSAYIAFSADTFKAGRGVTFADRSAEVKRKWDALSEASKEDHRDRAAKELQAYQESLKVWSENFDKKDELNALKQQISELKVKMKAPLSPESEPIDTHARGKKATSKVPGGDKSTATKKRSKKSDN